MTKKLIAVLVTLLALAGLTACSDANVASRNNAVAADNFEIERRVVFFNGITDEYLLTIEGKCSIAADAVDSQLEVTCKTGEDQYKKHFLGLSDNVTYFVEQIEPNEASAFHYRVIFKPETIVPDIDIKTS